MNYYGYHTRTATLFSHINDVIVIFDDVDVIFIHDTTDEHPSATTHITKHPVIYEALIMGPVPSFFTNTHDPPPYAMTNTSYADSDHKKSYGYYSISEDFDERIREEQ